MYLFRSAAILMISATAMADAGDYIVGGGVETDTEDARVLAAFGEVGISRETWLFGSIANNTSELPNRPDLETWYGDIGIDHWFKPVGVRAAVAYWGDSDTFDSIDWRASIYLRNEKASIEAEYEFRDFDLVFPSFGTNPARRGEFDATGIGLRASVDITENVDFRIGGIDYDYSRDISLEDNPGLVDLISFSRLSLVNSLVDYRANVTFGLADDTRYWELDIATWRGEVDGGRTDSYTIRFLTPMGDASDIEFGIGFDNSELYGDVTFFSLFFYFYGT